MAQPTRCDGHAVRRRLSRQILRRKRWRRKLRAERKRPRRSGSSSARLQGVLDGAPHFFYLRTHIARSLTPGPTCQAAECAGSCGVTLAIHSTDERGDSDGKESEGRKEEGGQEEIALRFDSQFPTPKDRGSPGVGSWPLLIHSSDHSGFTPSRIRTFRTTSHCTS
jgi:hypothetical protein